MINSFITDQALIKKLVSNFYIIDGGGEEDFTIYKDSNNTLWKFEFLESELLKKDISVLYAPIKPTIDSLIKIIIETKTLDSVAAASLILYYRNFDNVKEYRNFLLDELNKIKDLSPFEKRKIEICIMEAGLYDATNKEPIINKTYDNVSKDASLVMYQKCGI